MFNINVQRETRTIVKAVGVLGWLIIFSVTTYLYVRQGCPHPELEYSSSSCQPYVYNAGLIPASYIPPMNIYKSLTMTGGGLQCYMERFLYSYQSLGLGYAQNFRSEIYCAFNGTTNYTKFAYIDSAPNIASRLLSEVYYGTTDQWNTDLVHNTTMASCYFIVNNSAFTTCTVTFKNGTTASDIPITPGMMKYFDYSPNLETLAGDT
ncbi:hypothetical protein BGX28_000306 [Mortierella sp. GBA30]|nr:hypothetical protein BGX28_000306 [Mortierella sp. GBA30]